MEKLYSPKITLTTDNEPVIDIEQIDAEARASTASRRDVHVAIGSYLLEAIAELCLAIAKSGGQFVLGEFLPHPFYRFL
jgi:hypothetical protein